MFDFLKRKKKADAAGASKPLPSASLKQSLLSLEQRLMFDAAAAATAAEVKSEQVAQDQAEAAVSAEPSADSTTAEQADSQEFLQAIASYTPGESTTEVAFVDPTVPDYQELLAGMDPNVEVIMLDAGKDGVQQIAESLAGRSGIDAIHLISHGNSGELQLGVGTLDTESMSGKYANELSTIQQSLSEQADILVYRCDFAQGERGQTAVTRLAELTGADVQASTDATGHISLGGDWEFEVQTGTIETQIVISEVVQVDWVGLLATETVKDTFSSDSYSNNNGTQSWSTSWSETDAGGGGASGGDVRVNSSQLRIDTDTVGNAISRGVNLSGATSATLTFDYTNALLGADRIEVRVSTDGGANYSTLGGGIFSSAANTGSGAASLDLSGYMNTNTRIQFIVTGTGGGERLYVDNVQISYETGVANSAPTISNLGGDSLSYSEGDGAVVIEQGANALVADVDSTNFDTGTLTVSIPSGGDSAEDVLSIRNQGAGAGQIGVSGSTITYGGTTIGTFTGGSSGSNLVITLNSSATPTAVTALVKNITYENTDTAAPTTGARTVRYALTDGDGGTSANYDTTVTVGAANDAPTFGVGDGQALTSFGSGWEFGKETIIQPDGKILVGGYSDSGGSDDFSLVRYNADGTLDTSFGGGDGVAFAGIAGRAEAMVLQADGKVVLSGYTTTGGYQVCLVRFNADGSLDTSFGGGDGVASSGVYGSAKDVVLQTDGKFLLAADLSNSNFNLMRFNSDGSLDTSFGGGSGYVSTDLAGGNDRADSLTIQADGKVLLSGFGFNGTSFDFGLVRYNTDGSLDTSFNGTGKVLTDFGANSSDMGNEVRMQADGKIVVAGWSDTGGTNDFAIARYNTNGTLDTGFGTSGKVTINLGGSDLAEGLTIQSDGKILVTGTAGINGGDVGLVRLNTDGTLDTTFGGGDGIVTTDYSGSSDDRGYSVAVQSDGRIVVSGTTQVGGLGGYNVALNRYSSTGSLDTTLDPVNTLNGTPTYTEGGSSVVLDADVQIFDAELSALNNFDGATLTLARNGGANAEDVFSTTGTLSLSGGNVIVSGTTIGTYTNSGGTLALTFNGNATQSLVNSAMQQIAYSNSSDAPPASAQIDWTFSDGNSGAQGTGGALQATGSTTVTITAVNDAPTITNLGGDSLAYAEGDGAVVIEQGGNALVADIDSTNFDTGTLTMSFTAGSDSAEDVLSIRNQGTGAGQIGVSGSNVTYQGVTIGTFTGGSSGSNLVITLNSSATPTAVTALVQNITYENTDTSAPTTGARTVRYVLTDGDGGTSANYDTTVTVSGVNDAPTITNDGAGVTASISIAENTTAVTTVTATDVDAGQSRTYSIIGGADAGRFTIDSSTGQLSFLSAPNYESATDSGGNNVYDVTVQVSDGNGGTDTQAIAVAVTNIGDTETLITSYEPSLASMGDQAYEVKSDQSWGQTFQYDSSGPTYSVDRVGLVLYRASDASAQTVTVSIRSSWNGPIIASSTISSSSLVTSEAWVNVNLSSSAVLTDNSTYYIQVESTGTGKIYVGVNDSGTYANGALINSAGASDGSKDMGFRLSNMDSGNTTPSINSDGGGATASINVAENATTVTTVMTTDPDVGQSLTYSIIGGADAGRFTIDSSTGQLSFLFAPNYESATDSGSNNIYDVTVQVSDGNGGTDTQAIAVAVTNANENPTDLSLSANSVAENAVNGTVVGTVSGTDPDSGDTKTYSLTDTAGGRFVINSSTGEITVVDGTLLDYESATNHSVTVRVTDSGGLTYDETFTINVTNVNETPTGADATVTITEDTAHTVTPANVGFSDVDAGDSLSAVRIDTLPSVGSLTLSGVAVTAGQVVSVADITAGNLVFTPAADGNGTGYANFTFSVRDSNNAYDAGPNTLTVDVTAANDAPVNTVPGAQTVAEDTPLSVSGLSVTDVDGNLSTVQLGVLNGTVSVTLQGGATISAGSNGTNTVTLSGSQADINATLATLIYQGTLNFNGSDTLTVTSTDANSGSDVDTVAITVAGVNDAPIRTAGTVSNLTVSEDAGLVSLGLGSVTYSPGGGADESGQTLTYAVTALPSGTIGNVYLADGTTLVTLSSYTLAEIQGMQFKPTDNASGVTAFQFNVYDSGGTANGGDNTISQFILITVNAVNDAPTITNLSGDSLSYSEGDGAVVIEQGANALAADVDSANLDTGTLTVSIPSGGDSAEDVLAIRNQGTGAGQIGVSGANVTYQGVTIGTFTGGSGGSDLVVTLNASATPAAVTALVKNITYENTDMNAPTTGARTVRYVLTDGDGGTSTNYDTTVTVSGMNDAPVLTPIAPDVTFVEGGLAQVIDATGTIVDVDSANFDGGVLTVSISANGTADDRLMVGNFGTGPGQVGLSGSNVTYEGTVIGTVSGGTSGSDPLVITFNTSATPTAAQEVYRSIQFNNVSDNPSTATRTLTIGLTDGDGGTATPQNKLVYVQGTNDAPVLTFGEGDKNFTEGALAVMIDTLPNISDLDSTNFDTGTLTITISANPSADDRVELLNTGMGAGQIGVSGTNVYYGGTLIGTQGGGIGAAPFVVTFNANADATVVGEVMANIRFWVAGDAPSTATRTVEAVLTDGDGGTSLTASKQITVTAVNDATVVTGGTSGSGAEDTTVTGTLTATDADGLSDGSVFTVTTAATQGTASIDPATGLWSYTPTADYNGSDSFTVTITDDAGQTTTQVITLTVTPVADITNDSLTTTEDTAISANVLTGTNGATADSFEGTPVLTSVTQGTNGTVTFLANGTVTYTPTANFAGTDSFTYTITSGGVTETATVTVTVTAVNDATVVTGGTSGTGAEDTTVTGTLTATDAEGLSDGSVFTVTANATNGTASIDPATGLWSYTPTADWNGSDSFTVTITDDAGNSSTQVITLTVTPVNDAPTAIALGGSTVAENAANGTVVGTASTTDVDAGDLHTYQLMSNAGGRFAIDSNTGVITVADGSLLNYEAATSHTVTIRTTDVGGLTHDQVLSIAVTDVNEATTTTTTVPGPLLPSSSPPPTGTPTPPATSTPVDPGPVDGSASGSVPPLTAPPSDAAQFVSPPIAPRVSLSAIPALGPGPIQDGEKPVVQDDERGLVAWTVVEPVLNLLHEAADQLRMLAQSPEMPAKLSEFIVKELDAMTESLEQAMEGQQDEATLVAATAAGVSIVLSTGYVVWALRGGWLLASLLATMPAWRSFDPLPVLVRAKEDRDREGAREDRRAARREDERVEHLFGSEDGRAA